MKIMSVRLLAVVLAFFALWALFGVWYVGQSEESNAEGGSGNKLGMGFSYFLSPSIDKSELELPDFSSLEEKIRPLKLAPAQRAEAIKFYRKERDTNKENHDVQEDEAEERLIYKKEEGYRGDSVMQGEGGDGSIVRNKLALAIGGGSVIAGGLFLSHLFSQSDGEDEPERSRLKREAEEEKIQEHYRSTEDYRGEDPGEAEAEIDEKIREARKDAFKSNAELKWVVNGKNSANDTIKRHHGWLAVDDEGNPLYTPVPLSKPISEWKPEEAKAAHKGYQFNTNATDSFPMDREYGESFADAKCAQEVDSFHKLVPKIDTSVIFVYHNEYFTTLVRSLHGVLNKTPPQYLKEIIIFDDGSDLMSRPWLGKKLRTYIKQLPKIVYKRSEVRLGLMKARMAAADMAIGEVLLFLDSHIEPANGYIEPLLSFLLEDDKHVVVPHIVGISAQDFKEKKSGISFLGFSWILQQSSITISQRTLGTSGYTDTPIMAGGLFAIKRQRFEEMGRYDPELRDWGGEEAEISLKTWMCHGRLAISECSFVGHVFRDLIISNEHPYDVNSWNIRRNKERVASVWMQPYDALTKFQFGPLKEEYQIEDVSAQMEIKKKLQCKDFDWYLQNVYPELPVPELKSPKAKAGSLYTMGDEHWCLDNSDIKLFGKYMQAKKCETSSPNRKQGFIFSGDGNIMLLSVPACVGVPDGQPNKAKEVQSIKCSKDTKWEFDEEKKQMKYPKFKNHCLQLNPSMKDEKKKLKSFNLAKCDENSELQKFNWSGPSIDDVMKGNIEYTIEYTPKSELPKIKKKTPKIKR